MSQSGLVPSLVLGVFVAIVLGGAAWVISGSPGAVPRRGVVLAAAPATSELVNVTVSKGDSAAAIGQRLQQAGVIDSASSFQRLARISGSERTLAAGDYEFQPDTSVLDALTRIRKGLTASTVVTIPEGMRLEQIADVLDQRGVVKAGDFLSAVNAMASKGPWVDPDLESSQPSASTLEGYLFPATYSFRRNTSGQEVVLAMMQALADRFTPQLRQEARAQGLSVHDVLTLASIVEREVVLQDERPLIAAVYRNRLKISMALQADPTVQYAIAARPGSVVAFGWWKRSLSLQDLQYDSSYNTYKRAGLPPGPIASPGIDSIVAVIRPASTQDLYFVARNDGSHAFARTFEEHQLNVQKYQP